MKTLTWGCTNNHVGRRQWVAVRLDASSYVVSEVHGGWLAVLHSKAGAPRKLIAEHERTAAAARKACQIHADETT